ncbi:RNA-dependent RNA polymerase [Sanxia water strider virus 4]|uniref:RNA-directed RNA polymerase L n=1 Tax=Sanxia water strider virus 4 TaxID=1608063 RepID=A0A0B5KK30_9MONO|nr:RNA-dependent RNA polymerase [Sanxia water strider virus 4]AJG39115.1 RNA-dependent RNA polymerase [Sanxia water strider virus 4]
MATFLTDSHLKSAILPHKREMLIKYLLSNKTDRTVPIFIKETAVELKNNVKIDQSLNIASENYYPYCWKLDSPISEVLIKGELDQLQKAHKISLPFVKTAIRHNLGSIDQLACKKLIADYSQYKMDHIERKLYAIKSFWELIRNNMISRARTRSQKLLVIDYKSLKIKQDQPDPIQSVLGYLNSDFLFLLIDCEYIVFDYEQVIMLHDVTYSRFLVYGRCKRHEMITSAYDLPGVKLLLDFYKWGDSIISSYGNRGFKMIKEIEAVCTGVILQKIEVLELSNKFLEKLLLSMEEDDSAVVKELKKLTTLLNREEVSVAQVVEIAGLFRHFGHPTIMEEEGCIKLHEIAIRKLTIHNDRILEIRGCLIRHFILNYIKKNLRWPNCSYVGQNKEMKRLVNLKPTHFNEHQINISLANWGYIVFEQCFDFDYFFDCTQLVSDKACSPPRQNFEYVYYKQFLKNSPREKSFNSRRLLHELLSRQIVDTREIVEIFSSGIIPRAWCATGLHPKERELNEKGRMFSVNTLEMRLFLGILEKNVATEIFKYLSFQTMTWSEATLTKHLLELTDPKKNSDSIPVVFSIDFFKFCMMWRFESTRPFLVILDELFGMPGLFSDVHKIFENTFYYLSSHYNPPDYLRKTENNSSTDEEVIWEQDSNTTWLGQAGGNEGVLQKMWTMIIGSVILTAGHKEGLEVKLIGSGDNQLLMVSFSKIDLSLNNEDYIKQYHMVLEKQITDFIKCMDYYIEGIGMILKIEETWISTKYFSYGKEVLVNGVQLTQTLKRVSRVFVDTSDSFPSLSNCVSSISAAGHSIALKSYDPIDAYYIAMREIGSLVLREPYIGFLTKGKLIAHIKENKLNFDEHEVIILMTIPKDMGGLPITNFLDYKYRGHPDPLTSQLLWLRMLTREIPTVKYIKEWIISGSGLSSNIDYQLLIQDPLAINWRRPLAATNVIKREMSENLKSLCRNKLFSQLFESISEESEAELVDYLISIVPCFPRVLNDLLRLSPEGAKLGFLAMFSNVRTLKSCLPEEVVTQIFDIFSNQDLEWYLFALKLVQKEIKNRNYIHFWRKFTDTPIESACDKAWECTTWLATQLRNKSWRLTINGSTTPHPSEQFKLCTIFDDLTCEDCHVGNEEYIFMKVEPKEALKIVGTHRVNSRGTLLAYYGSGTSEKRGTPLLPFPKTDRSIAASKQLYRIRNWVCSEDGSLQPFIDSLIQSRTEIPKEMIVMIAGENYGGSMTHRFSDVVMKHEARPNNRANVNSQVFISSDMLGKFSRGMENYEIHFQGIYLDTLSAVATYYTYKNIGDSKDLILHVHPACNSCLRLCDDTSLISTKQPPRVPILRDCPLIYSSLANLSEHYRLDKFRGVTFLKFNQSDDVKNAAIQAAATILLNLIAIRTSSNIKVVGYTEEQFQGVLPMTIGSIIKLGILNVIETLSVYWLLMNMDKILFHPSFFSMIDDIPQLIESILIKFNLGNWSNLVSAMCTPEVRDELIRSKLFPHSSEAFHTGRSMEYLIKDIFLGGINKLFKKKLLCRKFIFFVVGSINYNLCSKLWVNSTMITMLIKKPHDCVNLYKKINKRYHESFVDGLFDHFKFISNMAEVFETTEDYNMWLNRNKLTLGEVGAEAWVRETIKSMDNNTVARYTIRDPNSATISRINNIINRVYSFYVDYTVIDTGNVEELIKVGYENLQPNMKILPKEIHSVRLNGRYSTAFLKYDPIVLGLNKKLRKCICLAEGSGSVARLLILKYQSELVYYDSLYDVTKSISHRGVNFIPAELLDLDQKRITGLKDVIYTGGDITKGMMLKAILKFVVEHKNSIDLLTCDAETSGEFDTQLALTITESIIRILSCLNLGTSYIFKTFMNSPNRLITQINMLCKVSSRLKIVVPPHSANKSFECFLVGVTKNHMTIDDTNLDLLYTNTLSSDTQRAVHQLCESRQFKEVQLMPKQDQLELIKLYNDIGFETNIEKSTSYYVNHLVMTNLNKIYELDSHYITNILIPNLNQMVYSRFEIMGVEHRGFSSITQKYSTITHRKESNEMDLVTKAILNLEILLRTLKNDLNTNWLLDADDLTTCVKKKSLLLYSISITVPEWLGAYGRFFFKIIGWSKLHQK